MKILEISKKNINLTFTILFFICGCGVNAQKISYKFSGKYDYETEYYTKVIINDSMYIEKNIFKQISLGVKFLKDTKTHTIYILDGKRKKLFFNGVTMNIPLIYQNKEFVLLWKKNNLRTSENNDIYQVTIIEKEVHITHRPIYYFTFENGVILIKGSESLLKREDFSYLDLPITK
ncbi:hypothetical protein AB4865_06675 [Capnocytophaga sp. ARDL2]|uniref:hypothetical protein n=1 Tax=Capnocytophaga sp. ARDL2 TaxID=3238809 RepID=UPI003555DBBD